MLPVISKQKQPPAGNQPARVGDGEAVDTFGRSIDYVRLSVTDRCNLRCVYCMPADGYEWIPRPQVLTFEEIQRLVRVLGGLGVRRIRLTGGEPTVRKDVVRLVRMIREVEAVEELSMTTNGLRLSRMGRELIEAGVDRFNVSLDSLRPQRFAELTRGGDVGEVLRGIETILSAGGDAPVKINVVVVGGVNDDEVTEIVSHFSGQRVVVRFIEYMPFTDVDGWKKGRYVPLSSVRDQLVEALSIEREDEKRIAGNGPAEYWRVPETGVRVGFIHPVSDHFCAACNRVRITADGELRPCLGHAGAVDLRAVLRDEAAGDEHLVEAIGSALNAKPERHHFAEDPEEAKGVMTSIGG